MARTPEEKREYHRKYYAEHKADYSKWARDRRERIKSKKFDASMATKIPKEESREAAANRKNDIESFDIAGLIADVWGEDSCKDKQAQV